MDTRHAIKQIRKLIGEGKIRVLPHAAQRMALRGYTLPEIEFVLRSGYHEIEHDELDSKHNVWTHAIRGSTIDGRDTRVVVAILDDLVVITVIGLMKQ